MRCGLSLQRRSRLSSDLLLNWEERERLGRNARDVMQSQQGATGRTAEALLALACPRRSPNRRRGRDEHRA